MNPGPIWPCLALFTPSWEAGNGATVASFGPPLTRRLWASRPWLWPRVASLEVARSGETFNSVAFGCIQLHFPFSEPSSSEASAKTGTSHTTLPPLHPVCAPLSRTLDSSLRWNDGGVRGNDVCDQCKGWGSDGAMGSCRLVAALTLTLSQRARGPAGDRNLAHNPSAPPPRVRSAIAHAGFQPSLE